MADLVLCVEYHEMRKAHPCLYGPYSWPRDSNVVGEMQGARVVNNGVPSIKWGEGHPITKFQTNCNNLVTAINFSDNSPKLGQVQPSN